MRTPGVQSRSSIRRGSTSHDSPSSSVVRARASGPDGAVMTGPTIVARSVAGPTRRLRTASARRRRNDGSSYSGASTIARLAAEHFWPAWPNAERTRSRRAASTSAVWLIDERVLAARLGEQAESGAPAEEQPGGVVGAGQHDAVDAGVGHQVPADVVVGAAHELDDVVGHAGLVDVADQLDGRGDGLGRRLEDDGVAGGEGGDDAVGRDRRREVPRPGDEHDAERVGGDAVGRQVVELSACTRPPTWRSRSPRTPPGRPRARSCRSRGPSRRACGRGWPPSPRPPWRARDAARPSTSPTSARRRRVPVATTSSMPSVDVISGGSSAGRSACRCSLIHARLAACVKSVSGSLANGASGSKQRRSWRRSWRAPGLTGHGRHGGDGGLEAPPLGVPRRRVRA